MKKLKVVTVVGTRPEIIRLSRLIPKLDEHTDHVLVHTGQNYDRQLSEVFFEELDIRRPDYFLDVDTASFGTVMGDTLRKSEEVFIKEKPDAVMILGDTNSAIAAVAAERMHIPVYHMEAGNRSFDRNVPEELNRRLVDHVSSFNLPYSARAEENLLREGLEPRFLMRTGSPMREIFLANREKFEASDVLSRLGLEAQRYILVSLHRQENVDDEARLRTAIQDLESAAKRLMVPLVLSVHPRTRARLQNFDIRLSERSLVLEPLGFSDYFSLQLHSLCVVSDSGSISEEASVAGFRAVTYRNSMERPEALDSGSIVMCGIGSDLVSAIQLVINSPIAEPPTDYQSANFSDRVLKFLFSTAALAPTWLGLRSSGS